MNAVLIYLVESSISIIMLYLVYWLFLRRDTFFMVNRFFLTGSVLFSLVFPIFRWNIDLQDPGTTYAFLLETVTITPDMVQNAVSSHLSLLKIVTIVYLTGLSLFTIRLLFQIGQVLSLAGRYRTTSGQGFQLVFTDRNYQPFSFFRLVFIPESLKNATNLSQIIEHEKVHVRQHHTYDLLLIEIMTIVLWFNPIIWFYRRSLKSIHEYLADEGVILMGYDKINYQELLLGQSLGIQVNDLTNNFNHSLLKNRIIMMTKQRSGTLSRWKAIIALPLVLCLALVFSTSVNSGLAREDSKKPHLRIFSGKPVPVETASIFIPVEDTVKAATDKDPVYETVKTMPEFVGGFDALVKYLVANIKYPEDAKKKHITGTVFVTFVVDKNGKVTKPAVLKGVDPLLDAEALRVVAAMPNWNPGRNDAGKVVKVQFNLPIKFALEEDSKKEEKK